MRIMVCILANKLSEKQQKNKQKKVQLSLMILKKKTFFCLSEPQRQPTDFLNSTCSFDQEIIKDIRKNSSKTSFLNKRAPYSDMLHLKKVDKTAQLH